MAKFDLNDDSLVVIVGSGAGGGTLGNELAQKGAISVMRVSADNSARLAVLVPASGQRASPAPWISSRRRCHRF